MKQPIVPYRKARSQLCTLTAINCIPDGLFWSRIGHTAFIYVDSLTGQVMLVESTTLNKNTGLSGVQMMPFGQWLARYPGKVYARVPKFGDSSEGANAAREMMVAEFIKEHLGTSYPDLKTWSGRLKLAFSALDFKLCGIDMITYKGDDDGIFCTMLFIMVLQYCDLYQKDLPAREHEPDDIRGNAEKFERRLQDMMYLPEIRLK